ncbi:MAG: UDP-N-acetylmuramoyl-L-alanine--D-glutamate ligase [Gammaproteobacteria bacterium]
MNPAPAAQTIVVGLGATGLSVARYLAARGERFDVADSRAEPPGMDDLADIDERAKLHPGAFDPALFAGCRCLIVSPGVAVSEPAVQVALAAGVEVIGDIELFAREAQAPICAISGSNGKSTVTSMVADMVRRSGFAAAAGGNLGPPALDLLARAQPDFYVLELSSFQLETTISLAPKSAAVLNLSVDHMDRYADLDAYCAAKARIYRDAETCVVNRDDPHVVHMANEHSISFGLDPPAAGQFGLRERDGERWLCKGETPVLLESELPIVGLHNVANALAALALGDTLALPVDSMLVALRSYAGLPHRTELVAEHAGVCWYNDSKATNIGATLAAIDGLPGRIVLIAGGDGKGADFSRLKAAVARKVRTLIVLGRDADIIVEAVAGATPVIKVDDMRTAVREANALAQSGDCVLLSPACASFDMFQNYARRGEVFMQAVREELQHAG